MFQMPRSRMEQCRQRDSNAGPYADIEDEVCPAPRQCSALGTRKGLSGFHVAKKAFFEDCYLSSIGFLVRVFAGAKRCGGVRRRSTPCFALQSPGVHKAEQHHLTSASLRNVRNLCGRQARVWQRGRKRRSTPRTAARCRERALVEDPCQAVFVEADAPSPECRCVRVPRVWPSMYSKRSAAVSTFPQCGFPMNLSSCRHARQPLALSGTPRRRTAKAQPLHSIHFHVHTLFPGPILRDSERTRVIGQVVVRLADEERHAFLEPVRRLLPPEQASGCCACSM